MNNIWLIIQREYLTRVKKKSFLIMTILGPLIFVGIFALIGYLSSRSSDIKTIEILDESGLFTDTFESSDSDTYTYINISLDSAKERISQEYADGLVYIPQFDDLDKAEGITFYAPGNPSIKLTSSVENKLETTIEEIKLLRSGIDEAVLKGLKSNISVASINLSASGEEKQSSSKAATIIGYISAFMIYMFVFIYGAQCMRGVIEEKTSRIVEIILSSTKTFHLMMGKVVGIAAVGLTQFAMWIILSTLLGTVGMSMMASSSIPQDMTESEVVAEDPNEFLLTITTAMESIDVTMTLLAFLFYFLGGYLLYGALFAAVGSAVDSDADAQQFMFPITIPLIASIASLGVVLMEPNGSFAFWMSMVPFTSPVVMMMRVPFGVPMWELALSMAFLIAGFIFTIWLASRIYRVGILMHGTKVNYKVLAKWFMMKH